MVTLTMFKASGMVVVTVTMLEAAGMATVALLETSGRVERVVELLGDPGVSDIEGDDESPEEMTVAKFDEDRLVVAPPVRILTRASPILSSASSKK